MVLETDAPDAITFYIVQQFPVTFCQYVWVYDRFSGVLPEKRSGLGPLPSSYRSSLRATPILEAGDMLRKGLTETQQPGDAPLDGWLEGFFGVVL